MEKASSIGKDSDIQVRLSPHFARDLERTSQKSWSGPPVPEKPPQYASHNSLSSKKSVSTLHQDAKSLDSRSNVASSMINPVSAALLPESSFLEQKPRNIKPPETKYNLTPTVVRSAPNSFMSEVSRPAPGSSFERERFEGSKPSMKSRLGENYSNRFGHKLLQDKIPQKSNKWKMLDGIFGVKKQKLRPASVYYQSHSWTMPSFEPKVAQVFLSKNHINIKSREARTKKARARARRTLRAPSILFDGQFTKRSSSQKKNPVLDVEIPTTKMDRYSVMFSNLLQSGERPLCMKLQVLDKFKSINEALVVKEKELDERSEQIKKYAISSKFKQLPPIPSPSTEKQRSGSKLNIQLGASWSLDNSDTSIGPHTPARPLTSPESKSTGNSPSLISNPFSRDKNYSAQGSKNTNETMPHSLKLSKFDFEFPSILTQDMNFDLEPGPPSCYSLSSLERFPTNSTSISSLTSPSEFTPIKSQFMENRPSSSRRGTNSSLSTTSPSTVSSSTLITSPKSQTQNPTILEKTSKTPQANKITSNLEERPRANENYRKLSDTPPRTTNLVPALNPSNLLTKVIISPLDAFATATNEEIERVAGPLVRGKKAQHAPKDSRVNSNKSKDRILHDLKPFRPTLVLMDEEADQTYGSTLLDSIDKYPRIVDRRVSDRRNVRGASPRFIDNDEETASEAQSEEASGSNRKSQKVIVEQLNLGTYA